MYQSSSIDIVIPSFRLDENILLNIYNVERPNGFLVNFYIVADNPSLVIPDQILKLATDNKINLIRNEVNLGFSKTRNNGIRLGSGKWVLLLDDDIIPSKRLLTAYVEAIQKNQDSIGFAGVTNFPKPFNSATLAMDISGTTGHFKAALENKPLVWVPTANVMLNREKMDLTLFNEKLSKGGEDIEFLLRNSLLHKEKYIPVPDAVVEHPWWNNGAVQTERIFRYGRGAADIAILSTIKPYTYHDFLNTSECLFLLLIFSPLVVILSSVNELFLLMFLILFAEVLTNVIKMLYKSKEVSFSVALNLFWIKNCYEAGYLFESLLKGNLSGFGERIEMGFVKEKPSWFRLNKWKIIKMTLLVTMVTLTLL
ncbi:glycosyltransferase family 2 protein [Pedobacter foliorum]|uniref:glycosyltransferase family 2 protein n=1 Tax=Pedobacter foliorum TaxID=2739058 RepID=UPI0015647144|nr:glycosyltransferase [Pedobacter foliorum]NRF38640.1 glycosyltransferase [Pedobacter foliorum]